MNVKDLRIKIKTLVSDTINKPLMEQIGKEISEMVKVRTRKGFGVPTNLGPQKNLKGLSESYKKQRRRLAATGRLSSETTANKSNLTKTGDMLDSISYTPTADTVTVSTTGNKNLKKVKYQAEAGRVAFNLSKSENKAILKIINESIKNDIRKKGL